MTARSSGKNPASSGLLRREIHQHTAPAKHQHRRDFFALRKRSVTSRPQNRRQDRRNGGTGISISLFHRAENSAFYLAIATGDEPAPQINHSTNIMNVQFSVVFIFESFMTGKVRYDNTT